MKICIVVGVLLSIVIGIVTAVAIDGQDVYVDDVRLSELRKISTGWLCKLSQQDYIKFATGGKQKNLFQYLEDEEDSANVVKTWLACTLHACNREVLPVFSKGNNERVYMRLLSQLSTMTTADWSKADFVKMAMLSACAARPEPAMVAAIYKNHENEAMVPKNAETFVQTVRLLRTVMHKEIDTVASKLSQFSMDRYDRIFQPLQENIIQK